MKKPIIFISLFIISSFAFSIGNNIPIWNQKKVNKSNTIIRIPSITKYSSWNNGINNWDEGNTTAVRYVNNLLDEEAFLNYSKTDTISKTKFTYLPNTKIASSTTYNYVFGVPTPSERYLYTYSSNSNSNTETVINQSYNTTTNQWANYERTIRTIDLKGNDILQSSERYENGNWALYDASKSIITYLSSGSTKIKEQIDSVYTTGKYEILRKEIFTYNNNADVSKRIVLEDNGNGLDTIIYYTIEYKTNRVPLNIRLYGKDTSNVFSENLRIDSMSWRNYDISLNVFEQEPDVYCLAEKNGNQLVYTSKFRNIITDNFNSTTRYVYEFNLFWVAIVKLVRINDSHFNEIENTVYDIVNKNETINSGSRNLITYDRGDMLEIIYQYYDNNNQTYQNNTRKEYSDYINVTTSIFNAKNELNLNLYPNPSTNGIFHVDIPSAERVELYNLQGQLVSELKLEDYKIEMKNVPNGLYLLVIYTNKGLSRTKISLTH